MCKTRRSGAILIQNLEIINLDDIILMFNGEDIALSAEFKIALNAYLKELLASPVRSLADVIAFNKKFANLVSTVTPSLSQYGTLRKHIQIHLHYIAGKYQKIPARLVFGS